MARSVLLLICLSLAGSAPLTWGETPANPTGTPPSKKAENAWRKNRKLNFEGTPSPEFENVQQALNALTPPQRKRFEESFVRWSNLDSDEKKALLDREQLRKKIMQKEVDAAVQESALQLDADQRAIFVKRYTEERRKIEEQLRKETNEKRKPLIRDLIGRLQSEFAPATPASSPVANPVP